MHPLTRANQDLYFKEEIHYPTRCEIDGCTDDIIGDPDGVSHLCFKHQNIDPDR